MKKDPITLTDKEMTLAFLIWRRYYPAQELDENVKQFLNIQSQGPWLKNVREGLFLTAESVARKMDISRVTYTILEESEARGTISLQNLRSMAESMGCELIYGVRPKRQVCFSQIIWDQVLPTAIKHPWMWACDQKKKANALAAMVKKTMNDAKFRRKKDWSRNTSPRKKSRINIF